VHGVDEAEAFLHGTFANEFLHGVRDVKIIAPMRRLEPEMFGERFHGPRMPVNVRGGNGLNKLVRSEAHRRALAHRRVFV
jgi:hypothetical protein